MNPHTILSYEIAHMSVRCGLSEKLACKSDSRFSTFHQEKENLDICIGMRHTMPITFHRTNPVFVDSRSRVYHENGRIYRYLGPLMDSYPETWYSCQIIDPKRADRVEICLRIMENPLPEGKLISAFGLDYLLGLRGKVLLHASFIEYQGKGILFTAPSGTGKSTQADLWNKVHPETTIINGDRAVLGVEKGTVMGYGVPFCGSSGISLNKSCPLRAIVVLRQGRENRLKQLSGAHAASLLLSECVLNQWDSNVMERVMDTITQIVERCPIYLYYCLPDTSAVDCLSKVIMEGERHHE